jgi:hypothetical protein
VKKERNIITTMTKDPILQKVVDDIVLLKRSVEECLSDNAMNDSHLKLYEKTLAFFKSLPPTMKPPKEIRFGRYKFTEVLFRTKLVNKAVYESVSSMARMIGMILKHARKSKSFNAIRIKMTKSISLLQIFTQHMVLALYSQSSHLHKKELSTESDGCYVTCTVNGKYYMDKFLRKYGENMVFFSYPHPNRPSLVFLGDAERNDDTVVSLLTSIYGSDYLKFVRVVMQADPYPGSNHEAIMLRSKPMSLVREYLDAPKKADISPVPGRVVTMDKRLAEHVVVGMLEVGRVAVEFVPRRDAEVRYVSKTGKITGLPSDFSSGLYDSKLYTKIKELSAQKLIGALTDQQLVERFPHPEDRELYEKMKEAFEHGDAYERLNDVVKTKWNNYLNTPLDPNVVIPTTNDNRRTVNTALLNLRKTWDRLHVFIKNKGEYRENPFLLALDLAFYENEEAERLVDAASRSHFYNIIITRRRFAMEYINEKFGLGLSETMINQHLFIYKSKAGFVKAPRQISNIFAEVIGETTKPSRYKPSRNEEIFNTIRLSFSYFIGIMKTPFTLSLLPFATINPESTKATVHVASLDLENIYSNDELLFRVIRGIFDSDNEDWTSRLGSFSNTLTRHDVEMLSERLNASSDYYVEHQEEEEKEEEEREEQEVESEEEDEEGDEKSSLELIRNKVYSTFKPHVAMDLLSDDFMSLEDAIYTAINISTPAEGATRKIIDSFVHWMMQPENHSIAVVNQLYLSRVPLGEKTEMSLYQYAEFISRSYPLLFESDSLDKSSRKALEDGDYIKFLTSLMYDNELDNDRIRLALIATVFKCNIVVYNASKNKYIYRYSPLLYDSNTIVFVVYSEGQGFIPMIALDKDTPKESLKEHSYANLFAMDVAVASAEDVSRSLVVLNTTTTLYRDYEPEDWVYPALHLPYPMFTNDNPRIAIAPMFQRQKKVGIAKKVVRKKKEPTADVAATSATEAPKKPKQSRALLDEEEEEEQEMVPVVVAKRQREGEAGVVSKQKRTGAKMDDATPKPYYRARIFSEMVDSHNKIYASYIWNNAIVDNGEKEAEEAKGEAEEESKIIEYPPLMSEDNARETRQTQMRLYTTYQPKPTRLSERLKRFNDDMESEARELNKEGKANIRFLIQSLKRREYNRVIQKLPSHEEQLKVLKRYLFGANQAENYIESRDSLEAFSRSTTSNADLLKLIDNMSQSTIKKILSDKGITEDTPVNEKAIFLDAYIESYIERYRISDTTGINIKTIPSLQQKVDNASKKLYMIIYQKLFMDYVEDIFFYKFALDGPDLIDEYSNDVQTKTMNDVIDSLIKYKKISASQARDIYNYIKMNNILNRRSLSHKQKRDMILELFPVGEYLIEAVLDITSEQYVSYGETSEESSSEGESPPEEIKYRFLLEATYRPYYSSINVVAQTLNIMTDAGISNIFYTKAGKFNEETHLDSFHMKSILSSASPFLISSDVTRRVFVLNDKTDIDEDIVLLNAIRSEIQNAGKKTLKLAIILNINNVWFSCTFGADHRTHPKYLFPSSSSDTSYVTDIITTFKYVLDKIRSTGAGAKVAVSKPKRQREPGETPTTTSSSESEPKPKVAAVPPPPPREEAPRIAFISELNGIPLSSGVDVLIQFAKNVLHIEGLDGSAVKSKYHNKFSSIMSGFAANELIKDKILFSTEYRTAPMAPNAVVFIAVNHIPVLVHVLLPSINVYIAKPYDTDMIREPIQKAIFKNVFIKPLVKKALKSKGKEAPAAAVPEPQKKKRPAPTTAPKVKQEKKQQTQKLPTDWTISLMHVNVTNPIMLLHYAVQQSIGVDLQAEAEYGHISKMEDIRKKFIELLLVSGQSRLIDNFRFPQDWTRVKLFSINYLLTMPSKKKPPVLFNAVDKQITCYFYGSEWTKDDLLALVEAKLSRDLASTSSIPGSSLFPSASESESAPSSSSSSSSSSTHPVAVMPAFDAISVSDDERASSSALSQPSPGSLPSSEEDIQVVTRPAAAKRFIELYDSSGSDIEARYQRVGVLYGSESEEEDPFSWIGQPQGSQDAFGENSVFLDIYDDSSVQPIELTSDDQLTLGPAIQQTTDETPPAEHTILNLQGQADHFEDVFNQADTGEVIIDSFAVEQLSLPFTLESSSLPSTPESVFSLPLPSTPQLSPPTGGATPEFPLLPPSPGALPSSTKRGREREEEEEGGSKERRALTQRERQTRAISRRLAPNLLTNLNRYHWYIANLFGTGVHKVSYHLDAHIPSNISADNVFARLSQVAVEGYYVGPIRIAERIKDPRKLGQYLHNLVQHNLPMKTTNPNFRRYEDVLIYIKGYYMIYTRVAYQDVYIVLPGGVAPIDAVVDKTMVEGLGEKEIYLFPVKNGYKLLFQTGTDMFDATPTALIQSSIPSKSLVNRQAYPGGARVIHLNPIEMLLDFVVYQWDVLSGIEGTPGMQPSALKTVNAINAIINQEVKTALAITASVFSTLVGEISYDDHQRLLDVNKNTVEIDKLCSMSVLLHGYKVKDVWYFGNSNDIRRQYGKHISLLKKGDSLAVALTESQFHVLDTGAVVDVRDPALDDYYFAVFTNPATLPPFSRPYVRTLDFVPIIPLPYSPPRQVKISPMMKTLYLDESDATYSNTEFLQRESYLVQRDSSSTPWSGVIFFGRHHFNSTTVTVALSCLYTCLYDYYNLNSMFDISPELAEIFRVIHEIAVSPNNKEIVSRNASKHSSDIIFRVLNYLTNVINPQGNTGDFEKYFTTDIPALEKTPIPGSQNIRYKITPLNVVALQWFLLLSTDASHFFARPTVMSLLFSTFGFPFPAVSPSDLSLFGKRHPWLPIAGYRKGVWYTAQECDWSFSAWNGFSHFPYNASEQTKIETIKDFYNTNHQFIRAFRPPSAPYQVYFEEIARLEVDPTHPILNEIHMNNNDTKHTLYSATVDPSVVPIAVRLAPSKNAFPLFDDNLGLYITKSNHFPINFAAFVLILASFNTIFPVSHHQNVSSSSSSSSSSYSYSLSPAVSYRVPRINTLILPDRTDFYTPVTGYCSLPISYFLYGVDDAPLFYKHPLVHLFPQDIVKSRRRSLKELTSSPANLVESTKTVKRINRNTVTRTIAHSLLNRETLAFEDMFTGSFPYFTGIESHLVNDHAAKATPVFIRPDTSKFTISSHIYQDLSIPTHVLQSTAPISNDEHISSLFGAVYIYSQEHDPDTPVSLSTEILYPIAPYVWGQYLGQFKHNSIRIETLPTFAGRNMLNWLIIDAREYGNFTRYVDYTFDEREANVTFKPRRNDPSITARLLQNIPGTPPQPLELNASPFKMLNEYGRPIEYPPALSSSTELKRYPVYYFPVNENSVSLIHNVYRDHIAVWMLHATRPIAEGEKLCIYVNPDDYNLYNGVLFHTSLVPFIAPRISSVTSTTIDAYTLIHYRSKDVEPFNQTTKYVGHFANLALSKEQKETIKNHLQEQSDLASTLAIIHNSHPYFLPSEPSFLDTVNLL